MSERVDHTHSSSCPGKRREAPSLHQAARASTTSREVGKDMDGRDKPGHDARGGSLRKIAIRGVVALAIVVVAFAAWVISLGPLPLDQTKSVSTTIVGRNGKLLRAYAMVDVRWRLPVDAKRDVDP